MTTTNNIDINGIKDYVLEFINQFREHAKLCLSAEVYVADFAVAVVFRHLTNGVDAAIEVISDTDKVIYYETEGILLDINELYGSTEAGSFFWVKPCSADFWDKKNIAWFCFKIILYFLYKLKTK